MTCPICRDCRHLKKSGATDVRYAKCAHPAIMSNDAEAVVTGQAETFCLIARQYGACGMEGALFEPRPRLWWKFWE